MCIPLIGFLILLSGCAHSPNEIIAVGWVWPLPQASQHSPEFTARIKAMTSFSQASKTYSWASQIQTARGASSVPENIEDALLSDLVGKAQAREAARRHLAKQIAALPIENTSNQTSPVPNQLGDPGGLREEQTQLLNRWISEAKVQNERKTKEGRWEVKVGLPLIHIAQLLQGESVPKSLQSQEGKPSNPYTGPMHSKQSNQNSFDLNTRKRLQKFRSKLPPLALMEISEAANHNTKNTQNSSRERTVARAKKRASQWIWQSIRSRPFDQETTLEEVMRFNVPFRNQAKKQLEGLPVKNVLWDSLGRCRVTVVFDWKDLKKEYEKTN